MSHYGEDVGGEEDKSIRLFVVPNIINEHHDTIEI